MSELSRLLGIAGVPHTIVHNGRTYSFRLIDQIAKDAFEKWTWQQEREVVYADRERMTSDQSASSGSPLSRPFKLSIPARRTTSGTSAAFDHCRINQQPG